MTSTASTSSRPRASSRRCSSLLPSWPVKRSTAGPSRPCSWPASFSCSIPSSARPRRAPPGSASTATGGRRARSNGDRRPPGHRHADSRSVRPGRGAQPGPVPPGHGVHLLRRVVGRAVHRLAGPRRVPVGDRGGRHGLSADDGPHARQVPRALRVTPRGRLLLFAIPAVGVAALLVWSFAGLPSFGHYRGPYGNVINARSVPERHASNAVAAVNFDYRGFDTIGEEYILFTSVMGV